MPKATNSKSTIQGASMRIAFPNITRQVSSTILLSHVSNDVPQRGPSPLSRHGSVARAGQLASYLLRLILASERLGRGFRSLAACSGTSQPLHSGLEVPLTVAQNGLEASLALHAALNTAATV